MHAELMSKALYIFMGHLEPFTFISGEELNKHPWNASACAQGDDVEDDLIYIPY